MQYILKWMSQICIPYLKVWMTFLNVIVGLIALIIPNQALKIPNWD